MREHIEVPAWPTTRTVCWQPGEWWRRCSREGVLQVGDHWAGGQRASDRGAVSSLSTATVGAVAAWAARADAAGCDPTEAAKLLSELAGVAVGSETLRAKAAGLDPARYAGHSLRAGLATSAAAAAGASERVMISQTGHRSADMVRRYIREGSLFQSNPAAMVGL